MLDRHCRLRGWASRSTGPAAEVYRRSQDEPWRVVRTRWRVAGQVKGPVEGGGRVSGYFTAATGISIHQGDAFICDAGSNLIHRKSLTHSPGSVPFTAARPETERETEFLASSDNWFRPVQSISGPDGALYIADMYREVIEHPWSLPASIKRHLDLNSGNDRGRIYRVVRDGFVQPAPLDLGKLATAELVTHLDGGDRRLAQQVLSERHDPQAMPALERILNSQVAEISKVYALQSLAALGDLEPNHLLAGFSSPDPDRRRHAIIVSEALDPLPGRVSAALASLGSDPNPEVRFQLALSLGLRQGDWRLPILAELLASHGDEWIRGAALQALGSSAGRAFLTLANSAPPRPSTQLLTLAAMVGEAGSDAEVASVIDFAARDDEHRFQFLWTLAKSGRGGDRLRPLSGEVAAKASDPDAPLAERSAAIRLHGQLFDEQPSNLLQLLAESEEPQILDAIAVTLQTWDSSRSASILIERWDRFSQQGQVNAINTMLSPARAPLLLAAVRDGKIPLHAIDGPGIDRLRNHPDAEVRSLAKNILDDRSAMQDRVDHFAAALDLPGDAARGRTIFLSRCSMCHREGDAGFAYGPDVDSFRSAGKQSILTNLIDPSREIAPQFASHELQLKDGKMLSGRIVEQNDQGIRLALPAGLEMAVGRDEIVSSKQLARSPMPERLESGLSQQEMADLLEFLSNSE